MRKGDHAYWPKLMEKDAIMSYTHRKRVTLWCNSSACFAVYLVNLCELWILYFTKWGKVIMHIDWNWRRMPLCPTSKGLRHITLKRSGAMIKFWYVHMYKPLTLSLTNLFAECHDNFKKIHDTNQQNAQTCSLDIHITISHWNFYTFWSVSDHHQWIKLK